MAKTEQVKADERRKFKRFDAFMSIHYKVDDPKKISGISLSQDLCRDGIKISTSEPIIVGSQVDMEIDIPDDPKPVICKGEIVWSKKAQDDETGFEEGVHFTAIDPVDKFRILDYAYNNWLDAKVIDFSDPEAIPDIS